VIERVYFLLPLPHLADSPSISVSLWVLPGCAGASGCARVLSVAYAIV